MSVQSDISTIQYVGNNSTSTPYVVPFYFFENGDLVVVVTDQSGVNTTLALTTDYTVTGAGDESGGTVTTVAAIPATSLVTIYREIDALQPLVYTENAKFPAADQERGLDRLTMLSQQLLRKAEHSFMVRESDDEIQPVAAVANAVLGFNSSKQPRTYTLQELLSFLSLSGSIVIGQPTVTFADAGERMTAVSAFPGQLGIQRDTKEIYVSTATGAGHWTLFQLTSGNVSNAVISAAMLASTLDFSTKTLTLPSNCVTTASVQNNAVTYGKIATNTVDFLGSYKNLRVNCTSSAVVTFDADAISLVSNAGTSVVRFVAPSTTSINITTSGANGLDTGSEQNSKWYHIWAISDGTNLRGLFSLSSTAPTLPGGYTYKMYLGAVRNNASGNFGGFYQRNQRVFTTRMSIFANLTGVTSYTSQDISGDVTSNNGVPPTAVSVFGELGRSVASALDWSMYVSESSSGSCPSGGGGRSSATAIDGFSGSTSFRCILTTPQTIFYKMGATTASAFSLDILGWEYNP